MSLNDLEQQVQRLPATELVKFAQWFETYREVRVLAGEETTEGVNKDQLEELLRRREEYRSNPSLATPWDDGFFDRLRQRLADVRSEKTPGR